MKTIVNITEEIVWNNELKLHEQSIEAQEWYNTNILPLLSFHIPKEIKQDVADRLNLEGTMPDEPTDEKTPPIVIDDFARPQKWIIKTDTFDIEVEYFYMNQNVNWNLDYIICKILNNG